MRRNHGHKSDTIQQWENEIQNHLTTSENRLRNLYYMTNNICLKTGTKPPVDQKPPLKVALPYNSDIPRAIWNPPLTRRGSPQPKYAAKVQINEAWKVKATVDPTLLPKGKSQAKHASVTLPENQEEELPEIEQTLRNPDTVTMMDFEQTSYFEMRLDNADIYDKPNAGEERAPDLHQVDAENITLLEHFESRHTDMFNHFERFDIEGDDDAQMNFTQPEDAQIPSTPVPSAPKEQAHKRSPSKGISIEKQRANLNNYEIPPEILMENLRANLTNMGLRPTEADGVKETGHMATPGSEILMETGPTQTQRPFVTQPLDMVTDTIRKQLKSHFDTPGSAETECLNELTLGLTKKQSACLFYQTCVLATRDFIKVQQEVPYENTLISRGAKM
ncbi:Sister chromatid cohesion 1 protein 1 [Capsicum chinense]|nr:Sister chromatid cohesion 1 protein 1 [Capsicum chinense]